MAVFKLLGEKKNIGFPKIISEKCNSEQTEILMEALGPNLKSVVRIAPTGQLSLRSVFMITIQLVSAFPILITFMYLD